MNYIKQIVRYFFYNEIPSEELKDKVQCRIVRAKKDLDCDQALKDIWDELGDADTQKGSWEESYRKIKPLLDIDDQPIKVNTKSIVFKWMQVAAMWFFPFIMLCVSGYFYFSGLKEFDHVASAITYTQYNVAKGNKVKYTLPDGSEVWLNAGSTLIYPSTFLNSTRDVFLIGEGYFDVKKDSLHPFVVNTNYMKLQVLGTTFNLSAYPDDSQIEATLETGAVRIEVCDDSISYFLHPNEQLTYNPLTKRVMKNQVNALDFSDWHKGGLFFNNVSFEDVIKELDRTLDIKIHLRTSVYNEQMIYVHFNRDESVEHIFQILKLMIPNLEYKITDKDVFIE